MKVSQSRQRNPEPENNSEICGCPERNSGLAPKRFFKSLIEHTEIDPEYLVMIIAWKATMVYESPNQEIDNKDVSRNCNSQNPIFEI